MQSPAYGRNIHAPIRRDPARFWQGRLRSREPVGPCVEVLSVKSTLMPRATAMLWAVLAAAPASASCDDRPGTPDQVRVVATSPTTIELSWRNTTRLNEAPNMCFDIYVWGDGVNRTIIGGACAGNVAYGSRSSHVFTGLAPGTTYYFSMRARTAPGTQGCISAEESNPQQRASAWTPTQVFHDHCNAYAARAMQQVDDKDRKGCLVGPGDPRWSSDRNAHYSWCLEVAARSFISYWDGSRFHWNDADRERLARDEFLVICRPPGQATAPPPPGQVLVPRQCFSNVQLTIRCQENAPAYATGCGASEEEAIERAKASFGACFGDEDDCCSYTHTHWRSQCDCGLELRPRSITIAPGGQPAPEGPPRPIPIDRPSPTKLKAGGPGSRDALEELAPRPGARTCQQQGMLGTWPSCYRRELRVPPRTRTCQQQGMLGAWPNCYRRPAPRPRPQPIG
jgi:hypothetical protein